MSPTTAPRWPRTLTPAQAHLRSLAEELPTLPSRDLPDAIKHIDHLSAALRGALTALKQELIYREVIRTNPDGTRTHTYRSLADQLGCAPSTINSAVTAMRAPTRARPPEPNQA